MPFSLNLDEFDIAESGKVLGHVKTEQFGKVEYFHEEIQIDKNKLIVCQCKACFCKTVVLKEKLVCDYCWREHEQHECLRE